MSWLKDNCRLLTFFVVVLASVGIGFCLSKDNQSSFNNCNEKIIAQYNDQIAKTDAVLKGVDKYELRRRSTKIDSLYTVLQIQYQQSLKDQKLFNEGIRAMLELEFNKIQNEYETQEIWVGLITIVFLVFSFYSIMKSEQFERQCYEDAEKIHDLTEKCQKLLASIESDKTKKLTSIDDSYNTWRTSEEDKLKNQTTALVSRELKAFRDERALKMEEIITRWDGEVKTKIEDILAGVNARVDATMDDYANRSNKMLTSTESKLNAEISRLLNDSEAKLGTIDIDKRIEAYMDAHTLTEEEIDKLFDGSFNTGGTMTDASTNATPTDPNQDNNTEDE